MMWLVVMTVTGPQPDKPQVTHIGGGTQYDLRPTQVTFWGTYQAETRSGAFQQVMDDAQAHFASGKLAVNFLVIEPD